MFSPTVNPGFLHFAYNMLLAVGTRYLMNEEKGPSRIV
jgi:hypothetical protein